MKRLVSFLSLFTSVGTLLCCALPALFVALGLGAAFAGLVGTFPQLIWVSENKGLVFGTGAVLLFLGGYLQWRARAAACPIDPAQAEACRTARDWSVWVYSVSVALYLVGAGFAFIPFRT
ncbi:MAG TPA: hypothetical protein VM598_01885 [Bdellovibrionota bacterium]|nr:hypothetical protein [Bdellovibrionota bacterium]